MNKRSVTQQKGKGSLTHNNREFLSGNVHKDKVQNNIIIMQQPLKEAYEECFGEATAEYNAKQHRKDRKIHDYFEHLFGVSADSTKAKRVIESNPKGKDTITQKSFYEDVVQIGDMDDTGNKSSPQAAERAKQALLAYMNGDSRLGIKSYAERNPQFHVFNAVIHMDEATPHLHIDYIPVATGYKTGLSVRNGYNRALEQMGYNGADGFKNWRDSERDVFRNVCRAYGLNPKEKDEEEESRGYTYTPEQYRRLMREAEKAKQEADEINLKARREADRRLSEANEKADRIISEANQKADKIITGAENRAKQIIAGAVDEHDRRTAEEAKQNAARKSSKRHGKQIYEQRVYDLPTLGEADKPSEGYEQSKF